MTSPYDRPQRTCAEVDPIFHNHMGPSPARDAFIEAQDGLCAICRKPFSEQRPAYLDHCHATGFYRGALCNSCNTKLGWYEKHQDRMLMYLKRAEIHYKASLKTVHVERIKNLLGRAYDDPSNGELDDNIETPTAA